MKSRLSLTVIAISIMCALLSSCPSPSAKSPDKAILSFSFTSPPADGVVDETAHTVTVTVPSGTALTALVATVEVSPGATVSPSSGVSQDFSQSVIYTVTAEDGTREEYTVTVIFSSVSVTGVTLNETSAVLAIGGTYALIGTVAPSNATNKSVTWSTTDAAIARVDSSGLVTAVSAGSVTIAATTAEGGKTASCLVTVQSSGKALLTFSILSPASTGVIDENGKAISVTLPYGASAASLVASFTTTGSSVKIGTVPQVSGTTANDFTIPVVYTVTAEDNSTVNYTVTVTVAALSWTGITSAESRDWSSISSSADGTKLAAAVYYGYIYSSDDGGSTWSERTLGGINYWSSVSLGPAGWRLGAACGSPFTIGTAPYTAVPLWTHVVIAGYAVTSSSESAGQRFVVAAAAGGPIRTVLAESPFTQLPITGTNTCGSVAVSSNGQNIAGAAAGGHLFVIQLNTDCSAVISVTQTTTVARDWRSIASSASGAVLAAVDHGGYIYTTTDRGAHWTEQTGSGIKDWISICSSADGTKLAAAVESGYIYASIDGGVTWVEQTDAGSRNWKCITSSADGTKLAACGYGALIYIGH